MVAPPQDVRGEPQLQQHDERRSASAAQPPSDQRRTRDVVRHQRRLAAAARTPAPCRAARRARGRSSPRPARSACRGRRRVRAAPCALRPAQERRRRVGVDHVVGERARRGTSAARPRPARRRRASPALVALMTTSKSRPASASGATAAIGPRAREPRRQRVGLRRACDWRSTSERGASREQRHQRCRAPRRRRRAPARRGRRAPRRGCAVRSRTSPAPSVLSAYQRVAVALQRVARARRLRALARASRASANASQLERHRDVEAACRRRARTPRPSRRSRRAARAAARSVISWPVARANASWICGDLRVRDGIADDGVAVHRDGRSSRDAAVGRRSSPVRDPPPTRADSLTANQRVALVNVHVRVMCRMSVSRRMSGGNAANGPAISTILHRRRVEDAAARTCG